MCRATRGEALEAPCPCPSDRSPKISLRSGCQICQIRLPATQSPAMASSAAASAVRRVICKVAATTPAASGTRQFHATGAKSYSNDYIHAEHMYDITGMKHRKVKMAFGVFGSLAVGTFVPIWAVHFQMKKQGGL